jgi:hypothetical protein
VEKQSDIDAKIGYYWCVDYTLPYAPSSVMRPVSSHPRGIFGGGANGAVAAAAAEAAGSILASTAFSLPL